MKLKKLVSIGVVAAMVASMAAGCGNSSKTEDTKIETKKEDTKETKETTPIKISAINTVSWAPVFIAESEGFFEEEGLDVEFTTPGGPKGFQAMQAGDCEFSMLSQEPLLIAQEQGMESKIIATMLKSRIYGFVSRKDITDISQLKGETIYGSDAGSAPYTFTCSVLEAAGLDPMNDVSFVQVADQNAGMQALMNGEVAAAFVNMSNLPVMGDFEYNVLADTTQPDQCEKYLGSSDFPAEMICTTSEYAKENPEVCQKVVNAIVKAQAWIADHSDEEVAASLKPSFGDLDETIIAEEIGCVRDKFSSDGMVSEAGEKAVVDMCVKSGLIKETIAYDDVVDMSFVEAVK